MARVDLGINGTAKILFGFSPALIGQLGENISFVFSRDVLHEVPGLFGACVPSDKLLGARGNFQR
jgi:hypothetical protein